MEQGAWLDYNGGNIFYRDSADALPEVEPEPGPVVVFMHGIALDSDEWLEQERFLNARGIRTLVYDMRAFGRSDDPTLPYSDVDDLLAVLAHKNIDVADVDLVAHSRAGIPATSLARRLASEGRRLGSLTLISPNIGGAPFDVDWGFWRIQQRLIDLEEGKEAWFNHPVFDGSRGNAKVMTAVHNMLDRYKGWQWRNPVKSPLKIVDPLSGNAYQNLGELVDTPVSVIIGENEIGYIKFIAAGVLGRLPDAEIHVLEGIGHMANMEAPDRVNEILLSFILKHTVALGLGRRERIPRPGPGSGG